MLLNVRNTMHIGCILTCQLHENDVIGKRMPYTQVKCESFTSTTDDDFRRVVQGPDAI